MTKLLNSLPIIKKTRGNHVHNWSWSILLTLTVLQWMKTNLKISQFEDFWFGPDMRFWSNIWKWLKFLNSVPDIKKTQLNHIYNWIRSFWLIFTILQWMKPNFIIGQFSRFLVRSGIAILVEIWKWLKLLNSVPFIKKTPGNHNYNWIWSFWLTFTVLQPMKTNLKVSQFSRFLQRSGKLFLLNIWKLLKLLYSVPFINNTPVNRVYNQILLFWLTFTVPQWMKTNFKISQFSRFLLRSVSSIVVKIWKWLKLLNSVLINKKTFRNHI